MLQRNGRATPILPTHCTRPAFTALSPAPGCRQLRNYQITSYLKHPTTPIILVHNKPPKPAAAKQPANGNATVPLPNEGLNASYAARRKNSSHTPGSGQLQQIATRKAYDYPDTEKDCKYKDTLHTRTARSTNCTPMSSLGSSFPQGPTINFQHTCTPS